jgi:hypothetical protein
VASVSGSVSVPAALVEPLVVEPSLSPLVALAPVVVVALVVELVLLAALVDDPSVRLSVAPPVEGSNSRLSLRQAALSSSAKQGAVIVKGRGRAIGGSYHLRAETDETSAGRPARTRAGSMDQRVR